MASIAVLYGVSRQRIKQVIDKFIPEWKGNYGSSIQTNKRAAAHFRRWGNKQDSNLYRSYRTKWRSKRSNAKSRGVEFNLDFGLIEWPTHCPVLGMELDYFAEGVQENSPSFDRYDSTKGYVEGNVTIMSRRANRIKNDGSLEELKKIVNFLDKMGQDRI